VSYAAATGLRAFMFSLAVVFAATPEEAQAFADQHGLWNRRPDGSWSRAASDAHAQLCLDQQAAYRTLNAHAQLDHEQRAAYGTPSGRREREARQAEAGAWMTRSVRHAPP
jgi:hypothetical protein